jgi:hypothetical protein
MTTPAQFSRARVDVLRAVLNEAEAHGLTKLELAEILSGEAASLIRKARPTRTHVHRASCHGAIGELLCGE